MVDGKLLCDMSLFTRGGYSVRAELQGEVWEFLNVYQKVLPYGACGPFMDIRQKVWKFLELHLRLAAPT